MEIGEIKTCEEYNNTEGQMLFAKSDGSCPAFCFWLNRFGDYKRYGYVGKTDKGSIWRETKKEVKEELRKLGLI